MLVHRPEAVMGYTHSHRCWVAIAPVHGVEVPVAVARGISSGTGRADLRLADERALSTGDVATLIPPHDVHNHGHVRGSGPSPYSLILLGDDMLLFSGRNTTPARARGGRYRPAILAARTADAGNTPIRAMSRWL